MVRNAFLNKKVSVIRSLVGYHCVMNVGSPYAREEQQEHMREVMNRHQEEADHIGASLW